MSTLVPMELPPSVAVNVTTVGFAFAEEVAAKPTLDCPARTTTVWGTPRNVYEDVTPTVASTTGTGLSARVHCVVCAAGIPLGEQEKADSVTEGG